MKTTSMFKSLMRTSAVGSLILLGLASPVISSEGIPSGEAQAETYSAIETEAFPPSKFGAPPVRGGRALASQAEDIWTQERVPGKIKGQPARGPASAYQSMERPRVQYAQDVESISARRKGIQEVSVIAGDQGFFPKTVFVTRDIPVRMFVTGASKNTLCLMMDSFGVRKQVRTSKIEEVTFTPNLPGQYRFYCPVNGMEGTMVVKELSSNASP